MINEIVLSNGKAYIVKEENPLKGYQYIFDGEYKAIGELVEIEDYKVIPLQLVKQYSEVEEPKKRGRKNEK